MLIKKYLVNNMNEGMMKIKQELGANALIISQRYVREKGIKGLLGKKKIEITAANDTSTESNFTRREEDNALEAIKKAMQKNISVSKEGKISKNIEIINDGIIEDNKKITELCDEIKEMKMLIGKIAKIEDDVIVKKLKDEDVISEIIELVENKNFDEATQILKKIVKIDTSDVKGSVVLVGPTGVGKTTTIAKLAGKLSLVDGKKVGLITIDTYRIAAVEQLKTYAQIMGIDFEVVINPLQMENVVDKMKDYDVVLIDTTGRSSKNKMQISELRVLIEKAKADSVSLVLSATTKNNDLDLIIKSYRELSYDSVIVTKLDETISVGTVLNIAYKSDKPIRFLTTGQNVPNDIISCDANKIINEILGDTVLC